MNESEIRGLIDQVRDNGISRKQFIRHMIGAGLTVPMAAQMLLTSGLAQAQTASNYKPTKRGGGGALKVLWWQGATLLQPHFASGTKDQEGSRIFYEPLGAWDPDGNLVPILAAEAPTLANGGVSKDGKSITWKLKKNVQWHDGKPFTADDVVFTAAYAADPATAAYTAGSYKDIKVTKVDSHTVKVEYQKPSPFWADPFVSAAGMII
ncbi:MAG: Oligopeptide-binding protein AppA precursor, partial [Pseudomonadota bacterium]